MNQPESEVGYVPQRPDLLYSRCPVPTVDSPTHFALPDLCQRQAVILATRKPPSVEMPVTPVLVICRKYELK